MEKDIGKGVAINLVILSGELGADGVTTALNFTQKTTQNGGIGYHIFLSVWSILG